MVDHDQGEGEGAGEHQAGLRPDAQERGRVHQGAQSQGAEEEGAVRQAGQRQPVHKVNRCPEEQ